MPNQQPLNEKDVTIFVFKAAMRDYFNATFDVQRIFPIPPQDKMCEVYDRDTLNIAKRAREIAFEKFFQRVTDSVVMKSDGTPYSEKDKNDRLYKISYDYLNGKEIIFLGTSSDGFVKMKPMNPAKAWGAVIHFNNGSRNTPDRMPVSLSSSDAENSPETVLNYDPRDVKVNPKFNEDNMDPHMPDGGGFWNKIVKFFFGHPSARWEKYENHLKYTIINTAMDTAELALKGENELSEETAKSYFKQAAMDSEKEKNQKLNTQKISKLESSYKKIVDDFRYDPESKTYHNRPIAEKMERQEQERQNRAAQEERERAKHEEQIKPDQKEQVKVDVKSEMPKAEQEADSRKERLRTGLSALNKSNGWQSILNHPHVDIRTKVKQKYAEALEKMVSLGQPNSPAMTEEEICDQLTTIYLVGEMMNSAKDGFTKYKTEGYRELAFGAIADELLKTGANGTPITDAVKIYMKENEIAKNYLKNPAAADNDFCTLKGMEEFVSKHHDAGLGDMIDAECTKNMNEAMDMERATGPKPTSLSF